MQANWNAEFSARIVLFTGVEVVFLPTLRNLIPSANLSLAKGSLLPVTFESKTEYKVLIIGTLMQI